MRMPRIRLSIAAVLGIVALVGVALAALRSPSRLWGSAFWTLTPSILVLSILKAAHSRGERRAYAVGFATCGWALFLAHYGPEPLSRAGYLLFTRPITEFLYPLTLPTQDPGVASRSRARIRIDGVEATLEFTGAFGGPPVPPPSAWSVWTQPDRLTDRSQLSPVEFRRIMDCLLCLAVATLGGVITRHFYRTRDDPDPSPA